MIARDASEIGHVPLIPLVMPPPGGDADDNGAATRDQPVPTTDEEVEHR